MRDRPYPDRLADMQIRASGTRRARHAFRNQAFSPCRGSDGHTQQNISENAEIATDRRPITAVATAPAGVLDL